MLFKTKKAFTSFVLFKSGDSVYNYTENRLKAVMDTDINIIADHLLKFGASLIANRPQNYAVELGFDSASDSESVSGNTLRLVTSAELCADYNTLKHYPLIIIGRVDAGLLSLLPNNAVVLTDGDVTVEAVQNSLYGLHWSFNDWYERLLTAVIESDPLQSLMEMAAEVIDNPIFLEDMESRLLGEIDLGGITEDEDPFLYQLHSKGYVDAEDFIRFSSLSEENELYNSPDLTPTFLNAPKTAYRFLVTYLSHNGQRIAAFQVVESKSKITSGQIAYARIFSQMLEMYFNHSRAMDTEFDENDMFSQLLGGEDISEHTLEQYLAHKTWAGESVFSVTAMSWVSREYGTPYTRHRLCFDLRVCFPFADVHVDGDRFLLLIRRNADVSDGQCFDDLSSFAEKNRLHVGISQSFSDIRKLKKYYLQSVYALEQASSAAEHLIVEYESLIPQILSDCLRKLQSSVGDIIPAELETLYNSGDASSNKYVATLHTLIQCGFNKTLTADSLNIHRNTLNYRLEKIETILGKELSPESFDDAELMTAFLACRLLLEKRKEGIT